MSSAVEIDGGVEVDVDDDDEQDEDASMNYGVDLNDPTVYNDDRAVGSGAQDTGTGVDTNTDDDANNDSANAVNGCLDRDSHASEPSYDSPATAEDVDQVSTEEGNNSVLSGDDAGTASDAGVEFRDMPAVDSEYGRNGEPHLHDGESAGEDQQSDGSESTTGVCGSVCGSMDMDNLGENQRGVHVQNKKPSTLPSRVETTDLTVYLQRFQQRNAICTLVDAFSANDPAFVNLWVFIVNGVQSGVPVEPPTGVLETQTGSWTRLDGSLACTIQTHLFSTLSSILTCQLLSQDEFKRRKTNSSRFTLRTLWLAVHRSQT
ncbi:hypothetical protein PsorP6_007661 [Peronosclerospora sorghi]|uniref:Uncharacterized protein n=1 Tax=Peronosclerospora sorghi TaxID=230839 RepID=A0ACC0W7G9_9STRA|nr:hypothetical protein PsorP6_007661 [Peronosclerospora sorghi]